MVPLLHHLRRQPPIPLCTERSTCHYDGKYRMEGGSLCSHSGITDAYLASAVYALVFTLFLGCIGYPLYLKKIYIKL